MARSRNIKPSFFTNDLLAECSMAARILFVGLWTIADREGRLEDRPKKIKIETLPYDDVEINDLLNELAERDFIQRYECENIKYIQVVNFTKHQNPHQKENPSIIPSPDKSRTSLGQVSDKTGTSRALTLNPHPLTLNPHHSTSSESTAIQNCAFRKIYDYGCNLFPELATRNTAEITKWVAAGVDPELDVRPEILRAKGKQIKSWNYFSNAIMDAKATREKPLPVGQARMPATPEKKSHSLKMLEASARVAEKLERENHEK